MGIDAWPNTAAASRTVTKANTGGLFRVSSGGTVAGSTTSLAAATYVQLTSSLAQEAYAVGIAVSSTGDMGTGPKFAEVRIGLGPATETDLYEVRLPFANPAGTAFYPGAYVSIPWLRISAGTRIAAKVYQSSAGVTWTVDLHLMPYTSIEGN